MGNRHVCPKCHKSEGLWREVMISGWVSVDEHLVTEGAPETDGAWWSVGSTFGCSECEWAGPLSQLIELGLNDAPLPYILPGQLTIEAA